MAFLAHIPTLVYTAVLGPDSASTADLARLAFGALLWIVLIILNHGAAPHRGPRPSRPGPGRPLRTSQHPVALVQRAENRLALRRLERCSAGRRREGAIAELRHGYAKGEPRRQDDGALDRVLELPHVSRPAIP